MFFTTMNFPNINLEETAPSLLTRDDITSILNERHLKIPNIELMGYEELLRIYETFAQPLEKRGSKRTSTGEIVHSTESLEHQFPLKTQFNGGFNVDRVVPHAVHDVFEPPAAKFIRLSFNTIQNVAKKRSNCIAISAAQEATPTKRRPIEWP